MFAPAADPARAPVSLLLRRGKFLPGSRFVLDTPLLAPRLVLLFPLLAHVGSVSIYVGFLSVQQQLHGNRVVHARRRRDQSVGYSGFRVSSNVGLHAEIPLIVLFRAAHFRVPPPWFRYSGPPRSWSRRERE